MSGHDTGKNAEAFAAMFGAGATPQGPGAEAGPVRGVPTMPPAPPSIIVRPEHGARMGDQTAEDFARMASMMLH